MGDDFFGGNDDFDFNDLFGVGGTGNNSNDILNDAMGGFAAASTTAAASSSGLVQKAIYFFCLSKLTGDHVSLHSVTPWDPVMFISRETLN